MQNDAHRKYMWFCDKLIDEMSVEELREALRIACSLYDRAIRDASKRYDLLLDEINFHY